MCKGGAVISSWRSQECKGTDPSCLLPRNWAVFVLPGPQTGPHQTVQSAVVTVVHMVDIDRRKSNIGENGEMK